MNGVVGRYSRAGVQDSRHTDQKLDLRAKTLCTPRLQPGRGNLILTGQLGEVMKESAQAALALAKARAPDLLVDRRRPRSYADQAASLPHAAHAAGSPP